MVGCGRPTELGLRRAGDHQRVHARGLRGHHVHHHARRVDGVAARHVEADPLDGHPAFGDRRTGRERGGGVGAPLVGVHGAGPVDRHLQRRADVGVQRGRARRRSSPAGTRTVAGRTPSNDSPYSRAASAPRSATASTIGRTLGTTASTSTPPRGSAARSCAALRERLRRSMRVIVNWAIDSIVPDRATRTKIDYRSSSVRLMTAPASRIAARNG